MRWFWRRNRELAKRLAELEAEVEAGRQRKRDTEYQQRALEELGNLPGTIEEKAAMLRTIDALPDEAVCKTLTAVCAAANRAVPFERWNAAWRERRETGNAFQARVNQVKQRDKCSKTEAMRQARLEFPDEYAAYQNGADY
jgi:hypothetical protein